MLEIVDFMKKLRSQFAFDAHQIMEKNSVQFTFSGDLSNDLIKMLLAIAKNNINIKSLMIKIYHIINECLDNLKKHSIQDT
jgi:D-arabinose 1-dehydrogenase-like Zn-dependent alcohol dehydrogenase